MPQVHELLPILQAYQPLDAEEAAHRARMLTLCELGPQAFSRDTFAPGHFTASAFVLSPDRSAFLLIFHGKLSRWLQPGGHVEPSDPDILGSARREVLEEVSLTDLALDEPGIFDLDVHTIPARKADLAHEHFDVRFLFRAPALGFTAGSDALSARWVGLGEISEETSDRSVMRAVLKLRARASR